MPNSVIVAILSGLAMGVVFGFALEKSRVFEPGAIVGQMQLRNFIMLKIFLTAVATGALVLAVLNGFGFVKLQPRKQRSMRPTWLAGSCSAPASRLRAPAQAPRSRKSELVIATPCLRLRAASRVQSRSRMRNRGSTRH